MLTGKMGQAVQLAMETLVQMGEGLNVECLIPTDGSHLGNVDLLRHCTGYIGIAKRFTDLGAEVQIPTSVNPYPADPRNSESPVIPEVFQGPNFTFVAGSNPAFFPCEVGEFDNRFFYPSFPECIY